MAKIPAGILRRPTHLLRSADSNMSPITEKQRGASPPCPIERKVRAIMSITKLELKAHQNVPNRHMARDAMSNARRPYKSDNLPTMSIAKARPRLGIETPQEYNGIPSRSAAILGNADSRIWK